MECVYITHPERGGGGAPAREEGVALRTDSPSVSSSVDESTIRLRESVSADAAARFSVGRPRTHAKRRLQTRQKQRCCKGSGEYGPISPRCPGDVRLHPERTCSSARWYKMPIKKREKVGKSLKRHPPGSPSKCPAKARHKQCRGTRSRHGSDQRP